MATASGCKVGHDYQKPATPVPAAFAHGTNLVGEAANASWNSWWKVFGDAELDRLIQETTAANHDLRLARARVRESRALRQAANSSLLPNLNAGGGVSRSRLSENSFEGKSARAAGASLENNFFTGGFDMSWELDLFGGARRGVEAATAEAEAAVESSGQVLVSVLAETGLNYLDLRGAQKELAVANRNLETQRQTAALTADRFKAGLASELDSARAEAQVATTRASLPPLDQEVQRAIHRLSVLSGRAPADLEARLGVVAPLPAAPPRVPVGLPSELLLRRPDVRKAERELAAATARTGVARADLFPRFFLTGAAGLQSVESGDFFDGGSRFWSLGPSVRWPVFAGGRIRQNIKAQDAREEQALIRYEQTVLTALEETENALVAFGSEQVRYQALVDAQTASRRAVALAEERYKGGLTDFLSVLEAQRSLLGVEDALVRSERTLGQNTVRLYKALGGGGAGGGGAGRSAEK